MKNTKKSLVLSIVTLLLCACMFVGSTFAWFTDTVSNTGNRIQAGTLKVDLLMDKGGEDYESIAGGSGDIFKEADVARNSNETLWEPGKTQFAYLAVENKGNLALNYKIYLDITDEGLVVGEDSNETSLEYAILPGIRKNSGITPTNWEELKAFAATLPGENNAGDIEFTDTTKTYERFLAAPNGKIVGLEEPTNINYFALAVHMKETAGNEYQGKDAIIDVTVVATQSAYEEDGFGSDQYDTGAKFPTVSATSASMSGETLKDLTINAVGNIKEGTVPADAANTVFNAMKDSDAASNDLTLTLKVVDNGNTTEGASDVVNLDIDMNAIMVSTKATGETTRTENKVESFSNYLVIDYQLPENKENVVAKHNGQVMTKDEPGAVDTGSGLYSYDKTTGVLTLKVKSLSPFAISYDMENWISYADDSLVVSETIEVGTAEELVQIAKLTNSGNNFKGKTVKLTADIDLGGKMWTPIGRNGKRFEGTFDGANHTISNLVSVLDSSSKTQYGNGLFGDITGGATLKNFTVNNANVYDAVDGKGNVYGIVCGYAYGNATFENIKVTNSKISAFGKVAAILGMAADAGGTTTIKNCSVEKTTIVGAYNVAPFAGLVQNAIDIKGCTTSNVKWEYSSRAGAECYTKLENVTDNTLNVHNGIYWKYEANYYMAAYSDSYNEQSEATLTAPFDGVVVDAVCHNN